LFQGSAWGSPPCGLGRRDRASRSGRKGGTPRAKEELPHAKRQMNQGPFFRWAQARPPARLPRVPEGEPIRGPGSLPVSPSTGVMTVDWPREIPRATRLRGVAGMGAERLPAVKGRAWRPRLQSGPPEMQIIHQVRRDSILIPVRTAKKAITGDKKAIRG
jgi:hypothetical protein